LDPEHLELLDEDIRDNSALADIKDWSGLAKSYISGQTLIGEHGKKLEGAIFVPGEDATDLEKASFYGKLGRPEKPEDYNLKLPEGTPEGFKIPDHLNSGFAAFAHGKGISAKHAQDIMGYFVENTLSDTKATGEATLRERNAAGEALATEWGDKFAQNSALIDKAISTYFPEDQAEKVFNMALGNAGFAKAMADIGKGASEDNNTDDKGGGGGGGGGETLKDIQDQRAVIMNDPESAYRNKQNPGHAQAVDDMMALTTKMIDLQNKANETGGA